MKRLLLLAAGCICMLFTQSQEAYRSGGRSALDPALYPFYHGVASGDPLFDRVILWTRITLDPAQDPVSVDWQIATDANFGNIVSSGNASTDSTKDYTIKVDATGLQANTWYYYRFKYDTFYSVTGRTKTLPVGSVNNIRFAVASCQDYQNGFYNAHRHMSQRNDIDAVLFLGDYTYEDGADSVIAGRVHEPDHKTVQLIDYRIRQSLYHLDPDLQECHRQYPWITVWDDHETANNSYTTGAKNHNTGSDGPWYNRKVNGVEAYQEWMPIRMPDPNDTFKIFRRFPFGDLIDLNMIDTRLYDRSKQAGTVISVYDSVLNDTSRTMLGPQQFSWLENNLSASTAKWQVIGQQVMMAPLVIPAGVFGDPSIANGDQWDGYPYERQRFYDFVMNNNISNVVVLTGDIHTSWANDLPLPNYDSSTHQNSVGVEFVVGSVTSGNELPPLITAPVISSIAKHVRYVDLVQHGYYVMDVTPSRTQTDFVYVSTILNQNFTVSTGPSWCVNDGERSLHSCTTPSAPLNTYPALAPSKFGTGINKVQDNITTISIQPNPFVEQVVLQYNTFQPEEINMEVRNSDGRLMLSKNLGLSTTGTNYAEFNGSNFAPGYYVVQLQGRSGAVGKAVIKVR